MFFTLTGLSISFFDNSQFFFNQQFLFLMQKSQQQVSKSSYNPAPAQVSVQTYHNNQNFDEKFESNESFQSIDQVVVIPLDDQIQRSQIAKKPQNNSSLNNSQGESANFRGGSAIKSQQNPYMGSQQQSALPNLMNSNKGQNSYQQPIYYEHTYAANQPQSFPLQGESQPYENKAPVIQQSIVNPTQTKSAVQKNEPKPIQPQNLKSQHQYYEEQAVRGRNESQDDIPEIAQLLMQRPSPSDLQMRKSNMLQDKNKLLTTGKIQSKRQAKPYKGPIILQIAKKDSKGQIVIASELYDLLQSSSNDVCLVTLGGLPVSGKSFVLNQILELTENKKFINQSEEPVFKDERLYYFLESSGGIFNTLSVVISSLFIFNILGEMEKDSLSTVMKIKQLVDQKQSGTLGFLTPQFIWLLRDNLSPKFNQLFKITETIILPPPADVKEISQILKLKPSQLTREFATQILTLKNRILNRGLSKSFYGVNLNGRMTFTFVEQAANALNQNRLDFEFIWRSICENESIEAFNQSIDVYMAALKIFFNDDQPKTFEDMQTILKDIRDSVREKFASIAGNAQKNAYYLEYFERLNQAINQKDNQAFKLNEDMASSVNEETLQQVSNDIVKNIDQNLYTTRNIDDFINEFNNMLESYNTLGIGMDKCYSLVQFLISCYPSLVRTLFDNCKHRLQCYSDEQDAKGDEEYFKTKIKELYERQEKLELQIKNKEKGNLALQQELKKGGDISEQQRELQIQAQEVQSIPKMKSDLKEKDKQIMDLKNQIDQIRRKQKESDCSLF